MNAQFTVPARVLLGMHSLVDSYRTDMAGVFIEVGPNNVRFVATNDHYMGIYYLPQGQDTGDTGSAYLDIAAWVPLLKMSLKFSHPVEVAITDTTARLVTINGTLETPLLDATFPDYQQILEPIPPESISSIGLNPAYLSLIGKAIGTIADRRPKDGPVTVSLSFSGQNTPITITSLSLDGFTAILMPCRTKETPCSA